MSGWPPGGARQAPISVRIAVALLLILSGCAERPRAGAPAEDEPLLVMAATSLNVALPELIDRFTESSGTRIDLMLGATGSLAAQIENGAPGDIFFAADEATVQRLVRHGLLRQSSERIYATGRLAMVWRSGVEPPPGLAALGEAGYEVVAIANPEHAPYGTAALEALRRVGIWDRIQSRIVYGENVAQAYQFVVTGNADVGIVARSVVDTAAIGYRLVDSGLHAPVRQMAAILERSTHFRSEAFLSFVMSAEGQQILDDHGLGAVAR